LSWKTHCAKQEAEDKEAAEKAAKALAEAQAKENGETLAEEELAEVEDDALLRESGNVLLDFINLRRQVAAAESRKGELVQ